MDIGTERRQVPQTDDAITLKSLKAATHMIEKYINNPRYEFRVNDTKIQSAQGLQTRTDLHFQNRKWG